MVDGEWQRTTTNSEALSLFLQLAAAQCGKPMAFRLPPTSFFPEAKPQEKDLGAPPGKAKPFRTVLRQSRTDRPRGD